VTIRFCVRCAAKVQRHRDEGHWRSHCPACGWIHYGNPAPAAGAVIVRGSRVLLVRRARPPYAGTWDIPGGFLEAGESAEAAVRRELREELGVTARSLRFIGSAPDRYGSRGAPILSLVFRATIAPGPLTPADDVSEARWFPRSSIPWSRIAFPSLRALLRSALGIGGSFEISDPSRTGASVEDARP
jgi:ADP-ribose pyrophosphatase YjhB (NUDIX family)